MGYSLLKRTETLVRDKEKFEIEGVRTRVSHLHLYLTLCGILCVTKLFTTNRHGPTKVTDSKSLLCLN